MILKRLVRRDRLINNKWVAGWQKTWGYFHLSMDCVRRSKTTLEVQDIYIPNEVLNALTEYHTDLLIKKGLWHLMCTRITV